MKIADVQETWIHTHFITDSYEIFPQERFKIDMAVNPELRRLGIQYGIHYERKPNAEAYTIVLECLPLPAIKGLAKEMIEEAIKDFPSRKKEEPRNVTTKISVEQSLDK